MPLVLVLEDRWTLSATLRTLCAFLEIQVEQRDSDEPRQWRLQVRTMRMC